MRLSIARLSLALTFQFIFPFTGALAADLPDSNTVISQPSAPAVPALPQKIVNPLKSKTITVKLKSVVVFTFKNPEIWRGKVVNPDIAKFVAGGLDSNYETNPSLTLLKKGKTTISLTDGRKTYFLKLTVS